MFKNNHLSTDSPGVEMFPAGFIHFTGTTSVNAYGKIIVHVALAHLR